MRSNAKLREISGEAARGNDALRIVGQRYIGFQRIERSQVKTHHQASTCGLVCRQLDIPAVVANFGKLNDMAKLVARYHLALPSTSMSVSCEPSARSTSSKPCRVWASASGDGATLR